MTAPNSSTDICNLALGILKEKAVSDVGVPGETNTAVVCAKWYDASRRYVLEMNPWHFAKKRALLAQDPTAPAFGWSAQSADLPSDLIRILSIGSDEEDLDYDLENNRILTNDAGPYYVRYIYDLQTVTKFSPTFVICLAYVIAAFASYEITGKDKLMAQLLEAAQLFLDKAAAVNGQQKVPKKINNSKYVRSRRFGYDRQLPYNLGGP